MYAIRSYYVQNAAIKITPHAVCRPQVGLFEVSAVKVGAVQGGVVQVCPGEIAILLV